jgi:type I restriction enzyme, R subunit
MSTQPESALEAQLMAQLHTMGYERVVIRNEQDLVLNLKTQLEKHNNVSLSASEFAQIINKLSGGSIFEKAKTLRARHQFVRDNGDSLYIEFFNTSFWCQNQYQVTHQITQEGTYKNRYDVTLLVNGLPLVQIELKRRGMELKEAFNQINRYQKHSFGSSVALFQYVQLFVISTGVDTKYLANNPHQSFLQTFFWTDANNRRITNLTEFADAFLERCHLSKMMAQYITLNETNKIPMVMRPYQYYAVEAIIERVKNANVVVEKRHAFSLQQRLQQPPNGYIWHTTGSGKTLTSFKASQIIMAMPQVHKVVFVVDRKDLDYQTIQEFNAFSEGSIDGTDHTANLVAQFTDTYKDKKGVPKISKLIVTTIQKLDNAIKRLKHESKMAALKDKRIVFIFDECHRSQFGDTHKRIKAFFSNAQMFGFTGTPILAENAAQTSLGKKTTKDLFNECLHKYVITDAIRDQNVLKFSVEYVGKYKRTDTSNEIDINVEDIDKQELMQSPKRIEKIVDYIIANHHAKTRERDFSAILCVDSIKSLIQYYDFFKAKKEQGKHELNIATIFSYGPNPDDPDADGFIHLDRDFDYQDFNAVAEKPATYHTPFREKLDECIDDYNVRYNTQFSTQDSDSFYKYYNDLSKKLKYRERQPENLNDRIDILLVVNMFLTGFDAKKVNTLYVDKNLQYHGLIQAFSRTNRILNDRKSQGNIVAFRYLKERTDEAITLYSNKEAIEVVIMKPYKDYTAEMVKAYEKLVEITPTVDSVNDLESESDEFEFVKAFREIMRVKNVLASFADFSWDDLPIDEQTFEDYKSKYLNLYDKVKRDRATDKVSILDEVDFELELIRRDEINVTYILQLLTQLKNAKNKKRADTEKEILNLLNSEATLRSKRLLIEKFITDQLPDIATADDITPRFKSFWNEQQKAAFNEIIQQENLSAERTATLIENYLFTDQTPKSLELIKLIDGPPPGILARATIGERLLFRIKDYIDTFINDMNL